MYNIQEFMYNKKNCQHLQIYLLKHYYKTGIYFCFNHAVPNSYDFKLLIYYSSQINDYLQNTISSLLFSYLYLIELIIRLIINMCNGRNSS